MREAFIRLYHGSFQKDLLREAYVEAWLAYHRTANKIDGHIRTPCTKEEVELCKEAVNAGNNAMLARLSSLGLHKPNNADKLWQAAKREALRMIDWRIERWAE